jgi:hypothetical protein
MNQTQLLEALEGISKRKLDLAHRKNSDYAGEGVDSDAFKNFRLVEQLGITSVEKGFLTRMTDKLSRASTLLESDTKEAMVKDESVIDTLNDLSVYADLLQCYLMDKRNKRQGGVLQS